MIRLGTIINVPYQNNPIQIDTIVKNYITRGFILSQYVDSSKGNYTKREFSLVNIGQPENAEMIVLRTETNSGGYAKVLSITFSTQDFITFKKWLNYLDTNSNFSLTDYIKNAYLYKYGNRSVSVGMTSNTTDTNAGGIETHITKVNQPVTYVMSMSYTF
ncbi:hypothetical protein [Chitinophaga silvisoli]|nr:hypothetical protein [Chitinophaga silvisoli]